MMYLWVQYLAWMVLRQLIILLEAPQEAGMNILDSQEMPLFERQMMEVQPQSSYILILPPNLPHCRHTPSNSPIFTKGDTPSDHLLCKILPNTKNTITMKDDDPNSSVKLFAYALLPLLFPQQNHTPNHSLLDMVKCSLYSKDINLNSHPPRGKNIDNLQGKAIITRFLHMLSTSSLPNIDRVREGYAALEGNFMLIESFALFFRAILAKLDLEGANDYAFPLPFEETVVNLLQFFDIHHRHLPFLFLLPQQNYFFAAVAGNLCFGQYFENQLGKSKHQITPNHQNSSSFSPCEQSNIPSSTKKNGVFQNDIKLFNFLLQSGRSSLGISSGIQKSKEIETPHFAETQQFAFGRRSRKQQGQIQRQQELKRQFQRLIMNCDDDSIPEQDSPCKGEEVQSPVTPVIGGQFAFKDQEEEAAKIMQRQTSQRPKPQPFLRKSTFNQSPMVDPIQSPQINPEQQRNIKNIVSVKDKNFTSFSPQPNIASKLQSFTNFANDAAFLDADPNADYFKSSSGKIAQITFPYLNGECRCFETRKTRNKIASRVIQFIFNPTKNVSNGRSPKFLHCLKYSQNIINSPKIKITPPKQRQRQDQQAAINKQQRIPTFLRSIKQNKYKDKYSASSKSKSKYSNKSRSPSPSPSKLKFQLDRQTIGRINSKFAKFSAILSSKGPLQSKAKQSNSTARKNQSSSLSKRITTQLGGTIKRFDTRFINTRPGLGSTWKSSSNFHHPYPPLQKKNPQDPPLPLQRRQTMRAFPSNNMLPPGMYLRGSNAKGRERENEKEAKEMKDVCVGNRVTSNKLAQAHSSEKYKEFTQIATVE